MEVLSLGLVGLEPRVVRLRATISGSSGPLSLVGVPADETGHRVTSALQQLGIKIQHRGLTVAIEPADLVVGAAVDLPVAIAALIALDWLPAEAVANLALLGELSPTGEVQPVRGVLPRLQSAARLGISRAIVPRDNAREAALVDGLRVDAAEHLRDVLRHFRTGTQLLDVRVPPSVPPARRILEVAAAGGHGLLLVGPSARARHLVARRLPSILPPMSRDEELQVTALASLAGCLHPNTGAITSRPFRAPHFDLSPAALLGGGDPIQPGEVSLAHHGVLFLDDLHQHRRSSLEALGRVLDHGEATIDRAGQRVSFPAKTLLIGGTRPCPCGLSSARCCCSPEMIAAHQGLLTGPFFERFDLRLVLPSPPMNLDAPAEASVTVQQRVAPARARQRLRALNAKLPTPELSESDRARRVARTIADLEGSQAVLDRHVEEALPLLNHRSSSAS